jgi:hypothetical protein
MSNTSRDSHDDWRELNPPTDDKTIETCISKFNNLARFTLTPAIPWSDHENSDPLADIAAGVAMFRAHHDAPPDKLVISPRLRDALLDHPLILQYLRHMDPVPPVTLALLAQLFDVADVIVV